MLVRICVSIAVALLSTVLFKIAAESLKLSELNIVSVIYYYMLVFNVIGISLIYIGFHDHYLIQKIRDKTVIDKTYYAFAYCIIMFPLSIYASKKIISKLIGRRQFANYIHKPVYYNSDMRKTQIFTLLLCLISTLSTVYVFRNLGYNPITAIISGKNLDVLRQMGSRYFSGNEYIRNIFMTSLTPMLSYYVYINFRATKKLFWAITLLYMVFLSVLVLIYDFEKAPLIMYFIGFYLIEILFGSIKDNKKIVKLGLGIIMLIVLMYTVMLGQGAALGSIYTGPLGRIFFTQISTLFLHFDTFPAYHAFLDGASFPGWMSFIFPAAGSVRSGRVVMETYNSLAVQAGTAGVMNTVFLGEAYANFGLLGILFSPVILGIEVGFYASIIPRMKKTTVALLLYVEMIFQYASMVEGGFVEAIYSVGIIFLLMLVCALYFVGSPFNETKGRRLTMEANKRRRRRILRV